MATTKNKSCCVTDCKKNPTMICLGCPDTLYCHIHYKQHRDNLNGDLHTLIDECNLFSQEIEIQTTYPQAHALMKIIDEWEDKSIGKIIKMAQDIKRELVPHIRDFIPPIKSKLQMLVSKIRQDPDDCGFVDNDLQNWRTELQKLKSTLDNPSYLTVQEDTTDFIGKIHLEVGSISNISEDARWMQKGVTIAGTNKYGDATNKLNYPRGLFIDDNQTVFIADYHNHRIVQWKIGDTNGQVIAGGNGQGNRLDQLDRPTNLLIDKENDSVIIADWRNRRVVRWFCRNGTKQGEILVDNMWCWGLAMDSQRYLYVSDPEKHEVRRFRLGDKTGIIVAGGNGHGNSLNQFNFPRYLFVDRQQNIYVADTNNHRVMKWTKSANEGIIVAGGNGQGNALTQLSYPEGIYIDKMGTVYVADSWNHRIVRWYQGAKQGTVIAGGNGQGLGANQFDWPDGLSFDEQGNLYVTDWNNHRVQRFSIE